MSVLPDKIPIYYLSISSHHTLFQPQGIIYTRDNVVSWISLVVMAVVC